MADMRQRREFGSRDERRGDLAIGCRRRDFVGVAKEDPHRRPHGLEAVRIKALDQSRSNHERSFHAGDAEIDLEVGRGQARRRAA
jgi:hypothetical protein